MMAKNVSITNHTSSLSIHSKMRRKRVTAHEVFCITNIKRNNKTVLNLIKYFLCTIKSTFSGDKTVVNSGNFDSKPCHPDLYQPFSFSSTAGSDCIFTKTICSEEGQVIKSVGSRRTDRECRCDYSRNFSFLSTKRKSMCSCDPTKEDCSCFIKPCGQEKILSPGRCMISSFGPTLV